MIDNIYVIALIILTVVVIYLYMCNEQNYRRELDKIEMLERTQAQRQRELYSIRSRTIACPIPGLNTPRKCYFDSQHQCSWNVDAERCDKL